MSDSFIPTKDKLEVTIVTIDGEKINGSLYVPSHERLVDVMNDDRRFLPFESDDGNFVILNKALIAKLQDRDGAPKLRLRAAK
jgi:hypothetical protein